MGHPRHHLYIHGKTSVTKDALLKDFDKVFARMELYKLKWAQSEQLELHNNNLLQKEEDLDQISARIWF